MAKQNILEYINEILKKDTEEILKEMLETSISNETKRPEVTVKSWKPIAALEAYLRIPIGFGPAITHKEIYEENEIVNNMRIKRDDVLHKLKDEKVFANWACGGGNSKSFTAVTVIDQNHGRLIGSLAVHYAFKSAEEALVYVECFRRLYRKLTMLARKKKGDFFYITKLEISIVALKEEAVKVCIIDIEDD